MKQSGVGDDAGEGLFSKIMFGSGDLVSMLNGTRVIPSLDEEWSDYKVGGNKRIRNHTLIKVHFSTEFDIDIPDNMRRFDPKEKLESLIEH